METSDKPIESRGSIMQTDKKPSELSTQLFDVAKSYSDMSRVGQLYGKLNMIMDMKLYLADEEIKVRKQIKESEEECLK